MQNKEGRKVLLQISNLKQYFPVGKKGLFVKANDEMCIRDSGESGQRRVLFH